LVYVKKAPTNCACRASASASASNALVRGNEERDSKMKEVSVKGVFIMLTLVWSGA